MRNYSRKAPLPSRIVNELSKWPGVLLVIRSKGALSLITWDLSSRPSRRGGSSLGQGGGGVPRRGQLRPLLAVCAHLSSWGEKVPPGSGLVLIPPCNTNVLIEDSAGGVEVRGALCELRGTRGPPEVWAPGPSAGCVWGVRASRAAWQARCWPGLGSQERG